MMKTSFTLALLALSMQSINAASTPTATLSNGVIQAGIYLPELKTGFYQGTRFDWSGVIYSFKVNGHNYYGPWFNKTDPGIHDFIYKGDDIVAGPCSAITGPVNEFKPLGYDEAKAGATFVKIGIGALRKPDDAPYDNYRLYEIADGGKWQIHKAKDFIDFTQTLNDHSSGYSYVYRKTLQLTAGQPEMIMRHNIRNTGTHAITTTVYNHNFLVLDGLPPGPGVSITLPFQIHSPEPPNPDLAAIRGHQIVYLKTLQGHDVVQTKIEGFGSTAADHHIQIDNTKAGAGMTIQSDRPLLSESLWSIRSVLAMEPFIEISIEPGHEFSWTNTYRYYTLPK